MCVCVAGAARGRFLAQERGLLVLRGEGGASCFPCFLGPCFFVRPVVVSTVDATAVGGKGRVGTCFCSGSVGGVVGIDCHTQRDGGGCGEEAPPPRLHSRVERGGVGSLAEGERETGWRVPSIRGREYPQSCGKAHMMRFLPRRSCVYPKSLPA